MKAEGYDFTGLTNAQQWLLTVQGWNRGTAVIPKPSRRTWKPLVDRGLAVMRPLRAGGNDMGSIDVPLDVHIAWCFSCDMGGKK